MSKKQVNYYFDKEIIENFDDFCKRHSYNKSALVERLLKEYMEKFNVEKKLS